VSEGGFRAVLEKEEEKRGEEKGRRLRWCLLLYRRGGKAVEGGSQGSHATARRTGGWRGGRAALSGGNGLRLASGVAPRVVDAKNRGGWEADRWGPDKGGSSI
jgi:hypothetical protein